MKKLLVLLLVFVAAGCTKATLNFTPNSQIESFGLFAALQSLKVNEECNQRCVDLKKEFRYIIYVGEKMYCYWDEKQKAYNINFKSLATEYENQISGKTSDADYLFLLYRWASNFRDGHVGPMLKTDLSEIEFYNPSIRFEVLNPDSERETLIVAQVGDDVSLLKVGFEVDTIQGIPWRELALEAEAYTLGSTQRMRRRQVGNLIFRALLNKEGPKPINIRAHSPYKTVDESVARSLTFYVPSPAPISVDTGIANIKSAILDKNLGYLRVDGFSGSNINQLFEQAMDRLASASGLLIDLRKNGGGDLSGNVILERLISENRIRYLQKAIRSDFLFGLRPEVNVDFNFLEAQIFSEFRPIELKKSKKAQFVKPVVLLTSSFCFSACDTFASAFRQNELGLIVGESTGGGTGTPQVFELPVSGHRFRYSVIQGFTAISKEYIEGVGTMVDQKIEVTVAERLEKKDRQLESALQILGERISSSLQVNLPANLLNLPPATKISLPLEVERAQEFEKATERK